MAWLEQLTRFMEYEASWYWFCPPELRSIVPSIKRSVSLLKTNLFPKLYIKNIYFPKIQIIIGTTVQLKKKIKNN